MPRSTKSGETLTPVVLVDPDGNTAVSQRHLVTLLDYDASGNLIYLGQAEAGTPTSNVAWRIKKFVYNGSNLTNIGMNNGTGNFDGVWDLRTSYTYS